MGVDKDFASFLFMYPYVMVLIYNVLFRLYLAFDNKNTFNYPKEVYTSF